MRQNQNLRIPNLALLAVPALYAMTALLLSIVQRGVRFDDPFITYRYAVNLAAGRGFVFNFGEATLITTAPLYALLLAVFEWLGVAAHVVSPIIGEAALAVGGWALWELGRRRNATAAFMAGWFFVAAPLMWLTIGFETPLFLAVSLLCCCMRCGVNAARIR